MYNIYNDIIIILFNKGGYVFNNFKLSFLFVGTYPGIYMFYIYINLINMYCG